MSSRSRGSAALRLKGWPAHWIGPAARPGGLVVGYARPAAYAFEPGLQALAGLLGDATAARRTA